MNIATLLPGSHTDGPPAGAGRRRLDGADWRRDGRPAPFLGGDELADELGIEPGPELGKVIKELEAARYAGEIESAGEAVSHARGFLAEQ